MIVKNEELLVGLHQLAIANISTRSTKDLLKVLVRFNENLLKDVNGIATSGNSNSPESNYVLSNYILNNMSNNEEESYLIKSHSNDNFDICNFTYVFVTVSNTVESVAKDFINDSKEAFLINTNNQNKKILGLKR